MQSESASAGQPESEVWVFGYGSLIWRPSFEFTEKRAGYIRGWTRRFWQHSTDHRGVPERPGRVVTLVAETEGTTWGVAYRLPPDRVTHILAYLDHREKGGYTQSQVPVFARDGSLLVAQALLYVATEGNPNWAGPAPTDHIARQIAVATGPSGANDEYLFRLAAALREMQAEDAHVAELEAAVRQLQATTGRPALQHAQGHCA